MFEGMPLSKALGGTELPEDEWDYNYRCIAAAEGKKAADDFLDWQNLTKAAMDTARKLDPPPRESRLELIDYENENTTATIESDVRAALQSAEYAFAVRQEEKAQKMLKPTTIPYYGLVYLAFINSHGEPLSVQQMYAFVMKVWPAFATAKYDWQSSIRNQLVTHKKIFEHAGQIGHNVVYNMDKEGKCEMEKRFHKYMSKNPGTLTRGLAQGITLNDLLKGKVEIPYVAQREKKEKPKKICKERTPKEPKKRRTLKAKPPQPSVLEQDFSNGDYTFGFPADQLATSNNRYGPSNSSGHRPLISMPPSENIYHGQSVSNSRGQYPTVPPANTYYQTGQVHQYPGYHPHPFINTAPFSQQSCSQNPMHPLYGLPRQQDAHLYDPRHHLYGIPQQQHAHQNNSTYHHYGPTLQQHAPLNNPMNPLYGLPQQQYAPQNIPTDNVYSLSQRQGIIQRPKYYYVVHQQNQQG